MAKKEENKRKYNDLWMIYEEGKRDLHNKEARKAWCKLYKTINLIDNMLKTKETKELYEIKYKMLLVIRDIQARKKYYEASSLTSKTAEEIRTKYLIEEISEPTKIKGMVGWLQTKERILKEVEAGNFELARTLSEELVEDLEALPFDEHTKEDRKILWKVYQILYHIVIFSEDNDKASEYENKAEDLAFIYDIGDVFIFGE